MRCGTWCRALYYRKPGIRLKNRERCCQPHICNLGTSAVMLGDAAGGFSFLCDLRKAKEEIKRGQMHKSRMNVDNKSDEETQQNKTNAQRVVAGKKPSLKQGERKTC